jgi:ABC-type oligopeptide transport system ATPase subunit
VGAHICGIVNYLCDFKKIIDNKKIEESDEANNVYIIHVKRYTV